MSIFDISHSHTYSLHLLFSSPHSNRYASGLTVVKDLVTNIDWYTQVSTISLFSGAPFQFALGDVDSWSTSSIIMHHAPLVIAVLELMTEQNKKSESGFFCFTTISNSHLNHYLTYVHIYMIPYMLVPAIPLLGPSQLDLSQYACTSVDEKQRAMEFSDWCELNILMSTSSSSSSNRQYSSSEGTCICVPYRIHLSVMTHRDSST